MTRQLYNASVRLFPYSIILSICKKMVNIICKEKFRGLRKGAIDHEFIA